ncbi:hypothetical protein [Accumulibacter sp.]|uniref:hypothetical protein n=1 Tax=Accumulibacter sp. TaxID=2053492 RepID=UPI0025F8655F|nr:hypothetical protein [Accumulibacter sp.]MCM8612461.1 hypothetical protein [Accumulibacter sp.]MCM8636858.1 hypothetical protein [Accumulibacter sp.]MCM8640534.1 hypothetical protein [Accumulibacter sp.]
MESNVSRNQRIKYELSTEQFASLNQVKAQSVRARLCRTGSYFGVVPLKLLSGRTAWPDLQVAK